MHVRLINEADSIQIIDLIYEIHDKAKYSEGHSPLNPDRIANLVVRSLTYSESMPCFVHDHDDGRLTGLLYGSVENTLYGVENWFHERVFYIRPEYRSYKLMRAYLNALQEWCGQEGITRIEFGNAFLPSARLGLLYRRMGYRVVNAVYAKRI